MSNQKRLSHLSFAAAALLAAALPCFAQTESNQARNNQAGNLNTTEVTQIAALATERLSVNKTETKKASDAKVSEKRPTLSFDQFRQAAKGSSSPTLFWRPKFRSAERFENRRQRRNGFAQITFVPSKGQEASQFSKQPVSSICQRRRVVS